MCGWDDRSVDVVHAIALKTGAIDRVLRSLKYNDGQAGWSVIVGRLVVGWLEANVPDDYYGLIVANPTHADRAPVRHTEAILEAARREDLHGRWPFDDEIHPTLIKVHPTTASATGTWRAKKAAADELRWAVNVQHPERVEGQRVLVVDDVTTTLLQLNMIADILLGAGAAAVEGLVIARAVRGR